MSSLPLLSPGRMRVRQTMFERLRKRGLFVAGPVLASFVASCAHFPRTFATVERGDRREVRVQTRAGHVLAGTLSMPLGRHRGPIAVFVSGAGPQTRDYSTIIDSDNRAFASIEDALLASGIGGFRFDEVGMGRSSGAYRSYATTTTLADDLADVLEVLESGAEVDATDIVLVGHSEGSVIAALAAARARRVRGLVLMAAPAVSGDRVMRDQWRTFAAIRGEVPQVQQFIHGERLKKEAWYRQFLALDPAAIYARVAVPVLILQGERDVQVPPWHADSVASLLRGVGKGQLSVVRFPDVGHAFVRETDLRTIAGEVVERVARWATELVLPVAGSR